jgi:predicted dienelactone hydrolase
MFFFFLWLSGSFLWAYDPLYLSPSAPIGTQEWILKDKTRSRDIPLRFYLPSDTKPAPVILFSHGLGGSREGSQFLGEHWAGRGYVAVFLQHPGSDESVWKNEPIFRRLKAMKEAANTENFMLRVKDVYAVLDQLKIWNQEDSHPLAGRLDLTRIGMSGHSFGAVTTQAVSGQKTPSGSDNLQDPRIKAAIVFSPSVPIKGDTQTAFGSVRTPWMLMTGTEDKSVIGGATVESRQQVYPALHPGSKYELVLFGAQHSVFTDRALPGEKALRNPNHHRAILALSTAFWDTWLRGDGEAKVWLEGAGPSLVLEAQDRWQHK